MKGITMRGYRRGMSRTPQGACLVYENGAEPPVMVWLQEYVVDTRPVVTAGQRFRIYGGACNVLGTVAASDPDAATRRSLPCCRTGRSFAEAVKGSSRLIGQRIDSIAKPA